MNYLNAIISDLRERKLWPVPVALLVALVAVPLLLSQSSAPTPSSSSPPALRVTSPQTGPSVSVEASPQQAQLTGSRRDPFTQQRVPAASTAAGTTSSAGATAAASAAGAATSSASGATASTGSAGGGSASGGGGSSYTLPPATVPATPPAAGPASAPAGLTATQSYDVAISISDSGGGVNPIDPLARLSVLPSAQQPMLVELGVLQGGQNVLFAVQPGTSVTGAGTCTPGPIDCEILSLPANQTVSVSKASASTQFAVTAITVEHHGSVAAAQRARRAASTAGARLLSQSTSSALSLFQYQPSLGVVVDQRNLTVGGN